MTASSTSTTSTSTSHHTPTFVTAPHDQNVVWGTVSVCSYLTLWVASLLSPFVLAVLAYGHCYTTAVGGLVVIVLCYVVPWPSSPTLRAFMAAGSIKYFRTCSLTFEESLVDTPKVLLAVHPHGIFCMGWAILFGRIELRHMKFCFSTALYNSPFFRVLSKLVGNPAPADKATFQHLMQQGAALALIPGGFESATITNAAQPRVHVGKKGFIKYALKYGYGLVPCYVFNEHQTYTNVQGGWGFRFWLNSVGLPAIVPWGQWWCPMLPKSEVDVHVVCGKVLQLPTVEKPTKEEVLEWHRLYVAALVGLYDEHKGRFGVEQELEVW